MTLHSRSTLPTFPSLPPHRGSQRSEHCSQSFAPRITRQHVWVGTPGHHRARSGSLSPCSILLHRPCEVLQEYACSLPGRNAPKERGVGGPRRHAERPTGAAAIRAAVRLVASHDHACTRTNPTSCRSSSSVPILRSMWESCDNGTRAKKAMGNVPPSCCVAPSGRRGDRSQTLSGQLSRHKQHPPYPSGVLCSDKHHVWAVTVAVTIPDKPPCILRERFYSGKTSV